MPDKPIPEWERLLSSAAHLQKIVPGAVLVGGTAAAMYAHHRINFPKSPLALVGGMGYTFPRSL